MTAGVEGPYKFHRCGVNFHVNHENMKEIIDIYKRFTFETTLDCLVNGPDTAKLFDHGQILINVNATLQNFEMKIPDGYLTEHESYSLSIEKSPSANEGINVTISAKYYPGYV